MFFNALTTTLRLSKILKDIKKRQWFGARPQSSRQSQPPTRNYIPHTHAPDLAPSYHSVLAKFGGLHRSIWGGRETSPRIKESSLLRPSISLQQTSYFFFDKYHDVNANDSSDERHGLCADALRLDIVFLIKLRHLSPPMQER